jgi:hypothetical protein
VDGALTLVSVKLNSVLYEAHRLRHLFHFFLFFSSILLNKLIKISTRM